MRDPREPLLVRPLSVGEILDRAVTLFVRNFVPFALIGLAYMLPLMVMQYFVSQSTAGSYQQLLDQIQHPDRVPPASLSSFPWGWLTASLAYSAVCTPFVVAAYAAAVRTLYAGGVPEWRAAYSPGLQRAAPILITEFLSGIVFVFAAAIGGFGFGFLIVLAALLTRASAAIAVVFGIASALAAIAGTLVLGVLYLALWFSVLAIAVEGKDVGTGFSSGFARVFARAEFRRALLVCLCFFAIYIGNFLLTGGVSILLDGVVRMRVVDTIVQGILQLCFLGFFSTLLAVYYFDVRVRREGLDIQRSLDELDASSAT